MEFQIPGKQLPAMIYNRCQVAWLREFNSLMLKKKKQEIATTHFETLYE